MISTELVGMACLESRGHTEQDTGDQELRKQSVRLVWNSCLTTLSAPAAPAAYMLLVPGESTLQLSSQQGHRTPRTSLSVRTRACEGENNLAQMKQNLEKIKKLN